MLDIVQYLPDCGKAQPSDSIGTAVVEGDAAGGGVSQSGAGKDHVWDVSHTLIGGLRRDQIGLRAVFYLPRLVKIQKSGSH